MAKPEDRSPGLKERLTSFFKPSPTPELLGTGAAAKAGKQIQTRKQKIEEALRKSGV